MLFVDFGEDSLRWLYTRSQFANIFLSSTQLSTETRRIYANLKYLRSFLFCSDCELSGYRFTAWVGCENNLLFVQSFWLSFYKSEYPMERLTAGSEFCPHLQIAYDNSLRYTIYTKFYRSNSRRIITHEVAILFKKTLNLVKFEEAFQH